MESLIQFIINLIDEANDAELDMKILFELLNVFDFGAYDLSEKQNILAAIDMFRDELDLSVENTLAEQEKTENNRWRS